MITRMRRLWPVFLLGAALQALATPQVSIQLPVPGYELYYVGDLDPRGDLGGVGTEISVTLVLDQDTDYNLDVDLSFGNEWLVRGALWADNVTAGVYGPWTLEDMRSGNLPGGSNFHASGEFNDDFLGQISGNALPSGSYTVSAHFNQPTGVPDIHASFTINDPRQVNLQTPWEGALIYTDQPTFSWSGRAQHYRLRVCEFNPDFHGSPQEALAGEPMWVADLGATSVVYGQSGGSARPLQEGRHYVWMVEALLRTTSGEQAFASAIRNFRLHQAEGGQGQPDLISLLGGLTPGQLAGLGNLLEGYHLNGAIMIDGQPVSLEEFQQLLQQLAAGQLNIASIRIE